MKLTQSDLRQFTGTAQYYYLPLFRNYKYTDGVKFLAEKAGAYWLLEKIFALQIDRKIANDVDLISFQVWKLDVDQDGKATLVCENGNGDLAYVEDINFTDLPLPTVELWLENKVLILPSEH